MCDSLETKEQGAMKPDGFRFFDFPSELRNLIYTQIFRYQPESGAILTIPGEDQGHLQQTFQYPIPRAYTGLLYANKTTFQEFTAIAIKVYTTEDFDADIKMKLPFQVKKIIVVPDHFNLLSRNVLQDTQMTPLMRWGMLSTYLRRIEVQGKLWDQKSTYWASLSYAWPDAIANFQAKSDGLGLWAEAISTLEKGVSMLWNDSLHGGLPRDRLHVNSPLSLPGCWCHERVGLHFHCEALDVNSKAVKPSQATFSILYAHASSMTFTFPPDSEDVALSASKKVSRKDRWDAFEKNMRRRAKRGETSSKDNDETDIAQTGKSVMVRVRAGRNTPEPYKCYFGGRNLTAPRTTLQAMRSATQGRWMG